MIPFTEETNKKKAPVKKKANTDESAGEDSDDGDEEGRELDYISDSSERYNHLIESTFSLKRKSNSKNFSISDHEAKISKEMKGVSDEGALRKLLTSDEEEEEEAEKSNEEANKSEQEEPAPNEETPQPSTNGKKKRKKDTPPTKSGSGDAPKKNEGNKSQLNNFCLFFKK